MKKFRNLNHKNTRKYIKDGTFHYKKTLVYTDFADGTKQGWTAQWGATSGTLIVNTQNQLYMRVVAAGTETNKPILEKAGVN